MLEKKLLEYIKTNFPKENKNVEHKDFKSLKHNISGKEKEDVISYISGLSNVEGGFLVVGIEDKTLNINGIQDFSDYTIENVKQRILKNTLHLDSEKFDVKEYKTDDSNKIVWIFEIPKHNPRKIVIAHNKKYQRIGDNLEYLTQEKEIEILNEPLGKVDWSSLICEGTNLKDLDDKAVSYLREKLKESKKDEKWLKMPLKNLLNSIGLLTNDTPNNTCILFLGKTEISDKYIRERNKISWRYNDSKNDIEERMSIEEQKAPLLLTLERVKYNINRFNTYLKDIDLFRTDIRQYDEKATIEELLINSLVHRDWNINLWNEIVQTPVSLEFRNPGIFRADLDKVLKENGGVEYLNPVMSEFFMHLNLMEKERGGLQKAYLAQLRKGTTIRLNKGENRVDFVVSGRIEDENFAKLVFKRTDIELDDLLLLDKIASGKNTVNIDLKKDEAEKLKRNKYIEIRGTRVQKCYISAELSSKLGKTGSYIRVKGVKTQHKYDLVLQHIEEFGKIKLIDLKDMFPELTQDQCKKIFVNMKKKGLINLIKEGGRGNWYYLKS